MTGQPTTSEVKNPRARSQGDSAAGAAELVLEDRFSMVPEWILDADISDRALRLYAVLLRYGNSTGARMPSRSTLATRLHKKSVDTVDRALAELVGLGAIQVEHRWIGHQRLTNRYRIRTSRPRSPGSASPRVAAAPPAGGRTDAATPTHAAEGGRTNQDRVAARMRHDRESSTETPPPPPPPTAVRPPRPAGRRYGGGGRQDHPSRPAGRSHGPAREADKAESWQRRHERLLTDCGITTPAAWEAHAAKVRRLRCTAGQPLTRWSPTHLLTALDLAVRGRGWPADEAAAALLRVAADPATRSPARLAEAGPWWDTPIEVHPVKQAELAALETELDAVGGLRVQQQRTARNQLATERRPQTRATVITRAAQLLRNHSQT